MSVEAAHDAYRLDPWMQIVGYGGIALLYGAAVVLAALPPERDWGWLRLRLLCVLGRYRYAWYPIHTLVGSVVLLYVFDPVQHPGWLPALGSYALELGALLGFAVLSWSAIERRFDRWKGRFAYSR